MADAVEDLKLTEVSGPKEALVGDEEVYADGMVHKVEPDVTQEDVEAVNAPEEDRSVDTVPVHETYVAMDRVITDPSSPEAVQIPDAGRGTLDLPIHSLTEPTVEEKFANGDNDEESRALPGTTVGGDDSAASSGAEKPKAASKSDKA